MSVEHGDSFLQDVLSGILSQPQKPTYKRARAVIRGALLSMPDGDIKDRLSSQLPSVLQRLKQELQKGSADADTTPKPRKKQNKQSKASAPAGADSEQRADTNISPAQASWVSNVRCPHCRPVLEASVQDGTDLTSRLQRAMRTLPAVVGCGSDHAPQLAENVLHLVDQCCSRAPDAAPPSAADLDSCSALVLRFLAILRLQRSQAEAEDASLLRRGCSADLLRRAEVQLLLGKAHVAAAQELDAASGAGMLPIPRLRQLVSRLAANAGPELATLCMVAEEIRRTLLDKVLSDPTLRDDKRPAQDASPLLAWLGLFVAYHNHFVAQDGACAVGIDTIVLYRYAERLFARLGDPSRAAQCAAAFEGRTCSDELVTWLASLPSAPYVTACRTALAESHSALVHHTMRAAALRDVEQLYHAWDRKREGEAGQGVRVAELDDDALFVLDSGDNPTAFDDAWAARSDTEQDNSSNDEEALDIAESGSSEDDAMG